MKILSGSVDVLYMWVLYAPTASSDEFLLQTD